MSYIPEEYTPTNDEIDEVMSLYNEWLDQAYSYHGNKGIAIDLVTERIQRDNVAGVVFSWVATNDATLIYDVDEKYETDEKTENETND